MPHPTSPGGGDGFGDISDMLQQGEIHLTPSSPALSLQLQECFTVFRKTVVDDLRIMVQSSLQDFADRNTVSQSQLPPVPAKDTGTETVLASAESLASIDSLAQLQAAAGTLGESIRDLSKEHSESLAVILKKVSDLNVVLVRSLAPLQAQDRYIIDEPTSLERKTDEKAPQPKLEPEAKATSDQVAKEVEAKEMGRNESDGTEPENGEDKPKEKLDTRQCLQRLVDSQTFEMVFAILIILNTLNMCAEAEYRGWGTGHKIGIHGSAPTTDASDSGFLYLEYFFTVVFTAEVVVKLVALKLVFWNSGWNVFDFAIIAFAWFDMFVDLELPLNPMLFRLFRLVRLLRMLETLRQFEALDTLFLMVKGIKASTPVLIWVVVLIFPMLSCCALAMNYILADFINDKTNDEAHRLKAYQYFGTFTRAMVSMFEVTFASFVPIARFLYQNVDQKYAVFFMLYKLVVGVAVVRIIYGVFLHVTFACATSDDEALIAKKNRETKKHGERMMRLFEQLDHNENGSLSRKEFERIHNDPAVKTFLSALELDVHDAELVFDLTDDGDGYMSAEEMIHGFARLKGAARSVDILALHHMSKVTNNKLDKMLQKFEIATLPKKPHARRGSI